MSAQGFDIRDLDSSKKISTSFFSVSSPLETDASTIKKHDILITSKGQFVEFVNEKLLRTENIGIKTAKKVLIHHEFNPPEKFIVILDSGHQCKILDYENFNVLTSRESVISISSEDPDEKGYPTLKVTYIDGSEQSLSPQDFLKVTQIEDSGLKEASTALQKKLRDCKLLSYAALKEKTAKEVFLARQLRDLQKSLQTANLESDENDDLKPSEERTLIQICSVRQRIAHEQWVLCVTILNVSERFLICDPMVNLSLCNSSTMKYRCYSLRSVQRNHRNRSQKVSAGVALEPLSPNILKPQKKVTLFAISSLPSFADGLELKINGIITFAIKPLQSCGEKENQKMVPIPQITLTASMMSGLCVNPRNEAPNGVSVDLVCLIAASVQHSVKFESLLTPFDDMEKVIREHKFATPVPDISKYFCCNSTTNELLHNVVFSYKAHNSNSIEVTIHAKNDQQAILFVATILSFFPKDTQVSESGNRHEKSTSESRFLEAFENVLEILINDDVEETSSMTSQDQKRKLELTNKDSWRDDLREARNKMDQIYVELNPK